MPSLISSGVLRGLYIEMALPMTIEISGDANPARIEKMKPQIARILILGLAYLRISVIFAISGRCICGGGCSFALRLQRYINR